MPMVLRSHDLYVDTLVYTSGNDLSHPSSPQEAKPANTGFEPRKHTSRPFSST
ncbi:hypothetical protein DPMN_193780 [Dreissena polymorpha]|uniref:Uncharacterized protein n=1 Tax=Dreissena polymorpha TaxID=45954 RepID=A0A9D3Y4T1_DREPO|nr:hypothetical protein DPMN_193780 [Dreissena polymorpha]